MKQELKITSVARAEESLAKHELPLFASQPAAGFPAPGDDEVEQSLDVNDLLVHDAAATFFVRVSGDSMEGAGIFNGDILVVDRSVSVESGSIVVAAVYGEMVVKRLQKSTAGQFLLSENEAYEPIDVTNNDDCWIWGVVTGSVRLFS